MQAITPSQLSTPEATNLDKDKSYSYLTENIDIPGQGQYNIRWWWWWRGCKGVPLSWINPPHTNLYSQIWRHWTWYSQTKMSVWGNRSPSQRRNLHSSPKIFHFTQWVKIIVSQIIIWRILFIFHDIVYVYISTKENPKINRVISGKGFLQDPHAEKLCCQAVRGTYTTGMEY